MEEGTVIKTIYQDALDTWGENAQLDVAIEEMSELIKEIIKYKRGIGNKQHMSEEIADVMIMLEQIMQMFGLENDVTAQKSFKIMRLNSYLEKIKLGNSNEK